MSNDSEAAQRQQRGLVPWKPGQSGNPAGRQVGSRNKLGEAFLADLLADWQENGIKAIRETRETKPDQYLKVVASILPKDINFNVNSDTEDLTDDELRQRIRALADQLAPLLIGTGGVEGRAEAPASEAEPSRVH